MGKPKEEVKCPGQARALINYGDVSQTHVHVTGPARQKKTKAYFVTITVTDYTYTYFVI